MLKGFLYFVTLCLFAVIYPVHSTTTTVFEDNFDDGNFTGWSTIGVNMGLWNVSSGEMQTASTQTPHVPTDSESPGAALITGITTPEHFSLEADIRVIGTVPGQAVLDFGHVGFVWGRSDSATYNATYLRTHNDHVTSFGIPGGTEHILSTPGVVNDVVYHLKIEVDFNTEFMSVTLDNQSATFSGTEFQEVNINPGAAIGLINWGERVGYDNVVLKEITDSQLSVTTVGQGAVLSTPAGIDCGDDSICLTDFADGLSVSLVADFDQFWTDGGWTWSGDCTGNAGCNLDMTADKTVQVSFHCLLDQPQTDLILPISSQQSWDCFDLAAVGDPVVDGRFEVIGPTGDVSFFAENSIRLGPGFRIGDGARFSALVIP